MFSFTEQSSDFAQKRMGLTTGARRGDGRVISIGQFVRMLVAENRYSGSILPRIPTNHLRDLMEAVKQVRWRCLFVAAAAAAAAVAVALPFSTVAVALASARRVVRLQLVAWHGICRFALITVEYCDASN